MNRHEFEFILQEGEGLKTEFKEKISDIDKEIVALANCSGGRIFVGVDDTGNVKGIDPTNKLKSQIQDIARNCDPSVDINIEKLENVFIINVPEGKNKPYRCKEGFFIRIGPNSQKMARDRILDLAVSDGKIHFDEVSNPRFRYPRDFDKQKLQNYLQRAGLTATIPTDKILQEFAVFSSRKKMNNAGILFFAKEPQRFISHSVYTCVLFRNKEGSDVLDRKEITGDLITMAEEVMKFIEKNIKVAYHFTGKVERENVYEYPLEAIREAVLNSIIHRDYFEQGHNNVLRIFPDEITITNVWRRPSWFELGRDTFRRNKLITELFFRLKLIEKIGSGLVRMKDLCRKVKAPVFKLDVDEKYFRLIFYKSDDYLQLSKVPGNTETVEKTVEKTVEIILQLLLENPTITQKELVEKTGLTRRGIEWNIEQLKAKGKIRRIGPDKGGHWEVRQP